MKKEKNSVLDLIFELLLLSNDLSLHLFLEIHDDYDHCAN